MRGVVFLEAPCRSQELLTLKWLLRSSGYEIVSTWHDASPGAALAIETHWDRPRLEQMTSFDALVVLRRDHEEIPAQLGLTAGFAAARRLQVFWIGEPLAPLSQFQNVHCFPNLEAFQKHLLLEKQRRAESPARPRLAA